MSVRTQFDTKMIAHGRKLHIWKSCARNLTYMYRKYTKIHMGKVIHIISQMILKSQEV